MYMFIFFLRNCYTEGYLIVSVTLTKTKCIFCIRVYAQRNNLLGEHKKPFKLYNVSNIANVPPARWIEGHRKLSASIRYLMLCGFLKNVLVKHSSIKISN